ncbi:MAG: hypothetical protein RJB18_1119 [Pseudomonadota bacterium]|jgi:hypothetical protein
MKQFFLPLVLLIALGFWAKFYFAKPGLAPISVLTCVDITQSCGNEVFTVQFDEAPQVMNPLHLNLHLNRAEAVKSIHVDFAMQDMEMGLNRYRLIQSNQSGDWQAEVTLPICVQGRSDWNMLLEIEAGKKIQRFKLPFSVKANRAN